MKTKLLLSFFLLWFLQVGYTQTDPQWLVLGGNGKSAYNESTMITTFSNPITSRMKLEGVAHIVPSTTSYPRNDVFVIYTDGSFYNSRDYTCSNYSSTFFQPTAGHSGDLEHYFNSGSKSIQAMYLSNIYESDDPPRRTKAASYTGSPSIVYNIPNTNSALPLSANHTVVMGKDITLIQKNNGISSGDTLLANQLLLNSMSVAKGNFFRGSNIFSLSTSPSFSNVPMTDLGNGKFVFGTIPAGTSNIFINLKGTTELTPHIGLADAMFTVKSRSTGNTISFLQEKLSAAHDPNFIELLSICEKEIDGVIKKFASYHMEFENTGDLPAEEIKIAVKFPSYLKKHCISEAKFVLGGVEVMGDVHKNPLNGKVYFQFDQTKSVPPCVTGSSSECTGYVEFCIRVKSSIDMTDLMNSFEFEDANVAFKNQDFEFDYFDDLPLVFGDGGTSRRAGPISDCTCTCD